MTQISKPNHYSLFTQRKDSSSVKIQQDVQLHFNKLLKEASIPDRAGLLRFSHQAKKKSLNTENFLASFINEFKNNPRFSSAVDFYTRKLNQLKQKQMPFTLELSPRPSTHKNEEKQLSPQQLAWQQVWRTLKRCINNFATEKQFAWHPNHLLNYYLAKLWLVWQLYIKQFGDTGINIQSITQEILDDRQQTVIENSLEAQQGLLANKMDFSPTQLLNRQTKLEQEKQKQLDEIQSLVPSLLDQAKRSCLFANQSLNSSVLSVFKSALTEIARFQRARPAQQSGLFALAAGTRKKDHGLATLSKTDSNQEMQQVASALEQEINLADNINTAIPKL